MTPTAITETVAPFSVTFLLTIPKKYGRKNRNYQVGSNGLQVFVQVLLHFCIQAMQRQFQTTPQ
jgi:hypothetical protein